MKKHREKTFTVPLPLDSILKLAPRHPGVETPPDALFPSFREARRARCSSISVW